MGATESDMPWEVGLKELKFRIGFLLENYHLQTYYKIEVGISSYFPLACFATRGQGNLILVSCVHTVVTASQYRPSSARVASLSPAVGQSSFSRQNIPQEMP